MQEDMDLLLKRLIENNVEFVIIGGFAAVAYGVTLVTQDIDVCCRFSVENLGQLQAALDDLNPVHRQTPNRQPLDLSPEKCHSVKNLYISTDRAQPDCLSSVKRFGTFDDALRVSQEIELDF